MTVTHVGPSYSAAKTTAAPSPKADPPSKPAGSHSRSWEAWELKRKTVDGKTVPYWERIPGRFDKEVEAPHTASSGDTLQTTPKSAQEEASSSRKPLSNGIEKKPRLRVVREQMHRILRHLKKLAR